MSRREGRESETRRCKIDRETSPKRSRRDGKPKTERNSSRSYDVDTLHDNGRDQKPRRRLQDALPLEAPIEPESKAEYESVKSDLKKKGDVKESDATKDSSNPTVVPRAQSYFQHDERRISSQSFNRRSTTDTSRWSDRREERSQGNNNNNTSVWHHDRFHDELEAAARKRPAFRETKTEQSRRPYSYYEEEELKRPFGGGLHRRRETQTERRGGGEKWKHDLFDEIANKETTTAEEQIAKLEALLA